MRPVRLPRTFCSCGKVEAFKVEHAIAKHLLKSALMISDDGQPEKLMSEVCCLKTTHRWPHTITFLTSDAVYQAEPTEELAEPEAEFEFARTESWKITAKFPISAVYYTRLMHNVLHNEIELIILVNQAEASANEASRATDRASRGAGNNKASGKQATELQPEVVELVDEAIGYHANDALWMIVRSDNCAALVPFLREVTPCTNIAPTANENTSWKAFDLLFIECSDIHVVSPSFPFDFLLMTSSGRS